MLKLARKFTASIITVTALLIGNACAVNQTKVESSLAEVSSGSVQTTSASQYSWTKVTDGAAFPGAYNFPVFVVRNQMWAFHPQGNWFSTDGKNWRKSELPPAGLNPGYQKYVQLGDAVYALGTMTGDYTNMRLSSRIVKTVDFKRWETVAEQSELPDRVFYGATVFDGKIWLLGGFDGKNYHNDVWSSSDAAHWTRVSEHAAWSPRNIRSTVVFKNRIWVIGGGVIDGEPTSNPKSNDEVWSSADGIKWTLETDKSNVSGIGTPIVFDEKLWLVGANRDGNFARSSLVTNDGVTWRAEAAPWSPRGLAAAWIFDNKLYITGGKYGGTANQTNFIYSNDVWYMTAASLNVAFLR